VRRVARALALLILLITGVLGLHNGVTERASARSALQSSVTIGVLLYGLLGLNSQYGVARRRARRGCSVTAWAVIVTYVSGTAALAYGGEDATILTALASGLAGALIGAFTLWATGDPRD
jgi:hypothetical protein